MLNCRRRSWAACWCVILCAAVAGCQGPFSSQDRTAYHVQNEALLLQKRALETQLYDLQEELAQAERRQREAEDALVEKSEQLELVRAKGLERTSFRRSGAPRNDADDSRGLRDESDRLRVIARSERRLRYDAVAGGLRFDAEVSFDRRGERLTTRSRRLLDELADTIHSQDDGDLRVLIAGQPPRRHGFRPVGRQGPSSPWAETVADYLSSAGVEDQQIEVIALDEEEVSDSDPPVQIFVLSDEAPVSGWAARAVRRR